MNESPPHTVTGIALLETKLFAPRWRAELVSRPRLVGRMDEGNEGALTLISAPAGSGKTTLLAEWLVGSIGSKQRVGWFSLGSTDNNPTVFWAYVIRAVQRIRSGVGEQALRMLFTPQSPPIQSILTTLINEISVIEDPFTLILDDYHVITEPAIHEGIGFLVEHKPPQMHLIIASRTDPPLPLARLRASRALTEIRAADLRFTPQETSDFLNEVMGLNLSADDVSALEARTEGWIAGLQLAALSMQGHGDVDGFIASFSGDDRYIVDYLVEEVLRRQTEQVRHFLLQTAILDRLNGPLCNAVTGMDQGGPFLEELERSNLFVVPLDDKREWYRYHHLFGEVLQSHLHKELPDQIPELHHKASAWYEQEDLFEEAIHHALAAKDDGRAADLIAAVWPLMNRTYQSATVIGWMELLPEALIRSRPILSIGYAWGTLEMGDMKAGDAWLNVTEALLHDFKAGKKPELDLSDTRFRYLSYHLASARTYYALAHGDIPGTIQYARQAQDLYPEADYVEKSIPLALMAIAYWTMGNLEEALRSFGTIQRMYREAKDILMTMSVAFVLAEIYLEQGRLDEASSVAEDARQLFKEAGQSLQIGVGDLHIKEGLIDLFRGELQQAAYHIEQSVALGDSAMLPGNSYRRHTALALLHEAQGRLDDAMDELTRAEQAYVLSPMPIIRPLTALKVRIWLKQGRLLDALDWASSQDVPETGEPAYMHTFVLLTLARIRIAEYVHRPDLARLDEALHMLDRLRQSAEAGRRIRNIIEIRIMQALGLQAKQDTAGALIHIERALTLAKPAGLTYHFTIEGEPMLDLLRHAAASGIGGAFTRTLLAQFNDPAALGMASSELVTPLTTRELEILRLIASGMRNQQIADHLFISLSTVKRHIANTYGKLDVTHRTEAIVKGEQLGLL